MPDTSLDKVIDKNLIQLKKLKDDYRFSNENNKFYLHVKISELYVELRKDILFQINLLETKLSNALSFEKLTLNSQIKNLKSKLNYLLNVFNEIETKQKTIDDIKIKLRNIESYRKNASGNELIELTKEEERLIKKLQELEPNLYSKINESNKHDSFSNKDSCLPENKVAKLKTYENDIINKCRNVIALLNKNDYRSKILVDIQESLDKCEKEFNEPDESNNLWKIAVIGQFSCGKSSFINTVIGEDIEPTKSTPVNHANTLFTYGENLSIKSGSKSFTLEEYKKEVEKDNSPYKEFTIKYPSEVLKNIELWDTPGIGSVNKTENESKEKRDRELSLEAAQKSDIVFYLLNITGGTINSDDLKYIKDIKKEKNIYIILTHSDKKSPKARETIKEEIIKKFVSNNIKINKENIFFYSSDKDKCLKSQDLFEYRNKVLALLKGFPKKEIKKCDNQKLKRELKANYDYLKDFVSNRKGEEYNDLIYSANGEAKYNFDREIYEYAKFFIRSNPKLIEVNKNCILSFKSTSLINHTVILNAQTDCFTFYNCSKSAYFYQYRIDLLNHIIFKFCGDYLQELKSNGTIVDSWTESGAREEIDKAISLIQQKYSNNQEDLIGKICSWVKQQKLRDDPEYIKNQTGKIILAKISPRWKEIDGCLKEIEALIKL